MKPMMLASSIAGALLLAACEGRTDENVQAVAERLGENAVDEAENIAAQTGEEAEAIVNGIDRQLDGNGKGEEARGKTQNRQ